jgi:exopolyphosphatase/guanosine-5'-triphosphate,3'-diphosphate pyrophosphatase
MVLSGTETKLLLKMLGREQSEKLSIVSLADFYHLYEQVRSLNLPQLVKKFNISEQTAEMVLPTIVLYSQILSLASGEKIIMPDIHFVDGITTLYVAAKTRDPYLMLIENQVVSLAYSLGRKYKYDVNHAMAVQKTALLLFDHMMKVHGLGQREKLLLKVAAILHDIGKYVSLRKHYIYSYRLITSSDMLGFSEQEKKVMATVAHYHSKGTPLDSDEAFGSLTQEQRVTVAKLIAIIRLSDAIDRSHRQKNVIEDIVLKGDELVISVAAKEDISLEEWTFADKTQFFEKVFGIRPILVRKVD